MKVMAKGGSDEAVSDIYSGVEWIGEMLEEGEVKKLKEKG